MYLIRAYSFLAQTKLVGGFGSLDKQANKIDTGFTAEIFLAVQAKSIQYFNKVIVSFQQTKFQLK